jgi:hypothetical protein
LQERVEGKANGKQGAVEDRLAVKGGLIVDRILMLVQATPAKRVAA